MSGADGVFNIAKGKVAYYATLPGTSDAIIATLWLASGLVADATLADYDTLAAIEAGASSEATTGTVSDYARQTVSMSAVTPDDANDRQDVAASANVTWTGLGGANNGVIAKLIIAYDPDTGTGTDADIIPLTFHSFDVTPDNSDVTATITTFFRASGTI